MTEITCKILEDGKVEVKTKDKHKYTVSDLKNVYKNLKLTVEHKQKQLENWKSEMEKGKAGIKNLVDEIDEAIKSLDMFEHKMKEIGFLEKLIEDDKTVG